jgi:hypothetical protein
MLANISKKIELRFWDLAIPLMSNNVKLRKLINEFYLILQDHELRKRTILIFACSFSGFMCGSLLFYFIK